MKLKKIYLLLTLVNLFTWIFITLLCWHYPLFMIVCLLAYVLGLRHGIDIDHIAIIDTVTRKFINEEKKPQTIGLFFAMGHSIIIFLLFIILIYEETLSKQNLPHILHFSSSYGKTLSAGILLLFAFINFYILCDIIKKIRLLKTGQQISIKYQLGGMIKYLFNFLLKMVNKSWHMIIIGCLCGLGLETAIEVVLLGMSGHQGSLQTSINMLIFLPILFAIGMCSIDTISGLLMQKAYIWAYKNTGRQLYYQLVMTSLSFLIALTIANYIFFTTIT